MFCVILTVEEQRPDICCVLYPQVECKKAQPKEVMFPPGTRGRARGLPYTMDAFMLGMGMLSKDISQNTTNRNAVFVSLTCQILTLPISTQQGLEDMMI